jgi:hypothetical protein
MVVNGRARDVMTTPDGRAIVQEEAAIEATIDQDRTITSIHSIPDIPAVGRLAGLRGGGGTRKAIVSWLPEQARQGTPLYCLLDDLPAATLIGGFAWHLWPDETDAATLRPPRDMTGICAGFRDGGRPAQRSKMGVTLGHNVVAAVDVEDPDDPIGWHDVPAPPHNGPCLRRRRRIDVEPTGATVRVDSMFRDAIWSPEGQEVVVHEYRLSAIVDRSTMRLVAVNAEPRVLPFLECPAAAGNVGLLVGEALPDFRGRVETTLSATLGCTHMNDMLRALTEVPILVDQLD